MNNPNIDISGWQAGYAYKKFDAVFFSGDPQSTTGCLPYHSGYHYCDADHTSSALSVGGATSNAPTGGASKWTQEFFSKPGYNATATFEGKNYRTDFGDGYFSLMPKSTNNIHANFNLSFGGRNDKETRAISNFLESHSFEALSGAISGVTGFTFESFYPYDKKDEYFCDGYEINASFSDVNTINTTFANEHTSSTDWMNRFISSGNTDGLWEAGKTYSLYDTVYHSGGVLGSLSGSDGYYYYTGASSTAASILNSPSGKGSLWTNDTFLFKPSVVSDEVVPIRFKNSKFNNDFNQRSNDGINTANLKLNVVLANRSNKEAVAVSKFLLSKQAYQTFKFTPPHPHNKQLSFVCESWRHNYVFDDNHTFELKLEQNPLDLSKKSRAFKTLLLNSHREIYAPYDGGDFGFETYNVTTGINFGAFMTGFASGTGMYIYNSGEQTIKTSLTLSGDEAAGGLFRLEHPYDNRVSNVHPSGLTYNLAPGESGRFDMIFSTTGYTGQVGENAGLGAASTSDDADRISFAKGRIMYTDEPSVGGIKESALIISTTDEFLFADPSGDLKLDLVGEAVHDAAPGAPINVMAKQIPERAAITGKWELADPKTATGISVLYSTDDVYYTMLQTGLATGVTTFTHEPVIPGSGYYYRVGASNCDIVGVGTSTARTFSTCAYRDNVATGEASDVVTVAASALPVVIGGRESVYNQLNISTLATGALNKLGLTNCNDFSSIICTLKAGAVVASNNPEIPALQTGPVVQKIDGTNLKLKLVVEDGAQIIGAGGMGADAVRQKDFAFAISTRLSDSVTPLSRSQSVVGSVHELQGVGPVSLWATSGSSEGKYLLPNGYGGSDNVTPFNGGSGGTAFAIHPSYREHDQEVEITNNYGRILGGGGGGGQGGTRFNNILHSKDLFAGTLAGLRNRERTVGIGSNASPSALKEVRAGGGGGGGAGLNKNTTDELEITQTLDGAEVITVPPIVKFDTAMGGNPCLPSSKHKRTNLANGEDSWSAATPASRAGGKSSIGIARVGNLVIARASEGGRGAIPRAKHRGERGILNVESYDNPKVLNAAEGEAAWNGGGQGGYGGGWGLDGGNGEHLQQQEPHRFQEPRNYGYGGSGGLCIQTNGCRLKFMETGYIPSSGMSVYGGQRTDTDAKSSELYRNTIGIGNYLTARCSGNATTREANDSQSSTGSLTILGRMSGLRNNGGGEMSKETETVNASYPAWKAFNQRIHGAPADYVLFETVGFPYFLTYDFGGDPNDRQRVESYTIVSAGASPSHYSTESNAKTMFSDIYAPTSWELHGTNTTDHVENKSWKVLHVVTDNVPKQTLPVSLKPPTVGGSSTEENDKSYVSIPGLIRAFPINNYEKFRYYRLKIISAEHAADKKCKIADFGLRSTNRGYAGFISSALHT